MEFFKASDCTEEFRKDETVETCLQFKMNTYFIKTRKIYHNVNNNFNIKNQIIINIILNNNHTIITSNRILISSYNTSNNIL